MSSSGYSLTEKQKKRVDKLAENDKLLEAKEYLEGLIKGDPADADTRCKLGEVYQALGETDKALEEFKSAIALDPQCYDAYYPLWEKQWNDAKDDTAKNKVRSEIESTLDEMLRKKPGDKLYSLAFFTYDMLKEREKRGRMRKHLLKEFPKSEVIKDIGRQSFENILEEQDRPKRVPLAEEYVNDFPDHPMAEIAYKIILTYYWKDKSFAPGAQDKPDKDKVREYTARWVKQSPKSAVALRVSARLLSEMDIELDNAVKWAGECVKLVGKNDSPKTAWYDEWQCDNDVRLFEAYDTLGWAYFKQGDYVQAEKYLVEAVLQFDFDSRTWYHLGKLFDKQGKPANEVLKCYARSLACRDNIKELPDEVKAVHKRMYPGVEDDLLEPLLRNLNRAYAESEGMPYFTDITVEAGLDKASGRRLAWGDYDNDGRQDVLIDGCRLWRNNGDGTFIEVTKEVGLPGNGYSGGVWADYDNDGFLDFFSFGWADALWRSDAHERSAPYPTASGCNNAGRTFTNVTAEVNPKLSDGLPTEGAGWGDYNRDGFLDLYLANYENPFAVGNPDFLWQNIRGKEFKDVTAEAKVVPSKDRCGRGVSWADYNDDGWPDIFVSNYRLNPNFLWKNNRDGTFTNVAKEVGVEGVGLKGYYGHTIGSDWADYDNDGDLDLFQANLAHPRYITFSNMSFLLKNDRGQFTEHRKNAGIRFEETHSDPAWVDFDNDGLLDLYITSVYPERPSFLYKQEKNGRFRDVTWLTGTRVPDGWGCAWADIDNDGDMDLIVSGASRGEGKGNIYLFRNEMAKDNRHNFLEVRLVGKDCNRSAIGARIVLTPHIRDDNNDSNDKMVPTTSQTVIAERSLCAGLTPGKVKYIREVKAGRGTTSQDSLVQHFGLGDYNKEITLLIQWYPGKWTGNFNVVRPNQIVTIEE
ncbi:MAG: FG-GAP-like repeat-containing protein [Planctomycetota bacterium]